jgi:hypothetical protein
MLMLAASVQIGAALWLLAMRIIQLRARFQLPLSPPGCSLIKPKWVLWIIGFQNAYGLWLMLLGGMVLTQSARGDGRDYAAPCTSLAFAMLAEALTAAPLMDLAERSRVAALYCRLGWLRYKQAMGDRVRLSPRRAPRRKFSRFVYHRCPPTGGGRPRPE